MHYFANGQLKARLPLDNYGQNNGLAAYYYANGIISNEGLYKNGLRTGEWRNYNADGGLISTNYYDKNGQISKMVKE